jgi:hypothetical protein
LHRQVVERARQIDASILPSKHPFARIATGLSYALDDLVVEQPVAERYHSLVPKVVHREGVVPEQDSLVPSKLYQVYSSAYIFISLVISNRNKICFDYATIL